MIKLINLYNVPKWQLTIKCAGFNVQNIYLWLTARINKSPLSKPINTHENLNFLNWGVSEIRINQNKGDGVMAVTFSHLLFWLLFCVTAAQPCFTALYYEKLLKGLTQYLGRHQIQKKQCPESTMPLKDKVNAKQPSATQVTCSYINQTTINRLAVGLIRGTAFECESCATWLAIYTIQYRSNSLCWCALSRLESEEL